MSEIIDKYDIPRKTDTIYQLEGEKKSMLIAQITLGQCMQGLANYFEDGEDSMEYKFIEQQIDLVREETDDHGVAAQKLWKFMEVNNIKIRELIDDGNISDLEIEFQDDEDVWDVSDLDEWSVEKIGG
mgnify:CR=1 FL=1